MQNEAKASKPYMRPATFEDAISLSPRLRVADLKEISFGSNRRPMDILLEGIANSDECIAIVYEDKVVALFGVVNMWGLGGSPWMLASNDLKKIAKSFLREAKGEVQKMLQKYKLLENHVWVGNHDHIEWLKWMGFTVDETTEIIRGGNGGRFFHFFMREVPDV